MAIRTAMYIFDVCGRGHEIWVRTQGFQAFYRPPKPVFLLLYCSFPCSCQNFKKMFSDKSLSKKETAFSSLGIFSIEMSQLSQSRRNDKEWWMQMSDLQTGRGTLNIISQFWIADSHRRKRMCWRSGNTDLLRYWRWPVFFFSPLSYNSKLSLPYCKILFLGP